MESHPYPILEFDPTPIALLEPTSLVKSMDVPDCMVICFFQEVISQMVEQYNGRLVQNLASEIGRNPVYEIEFHGQRLMIGHPGVGAPLAAGFLEEFIALGSRKFIVCGGAGVLNSQITQGHLIIPTEALRDEGTSYHYLPPSRTVKAHPAALAAIEATFARHQVDYITGLTWTTDAIYRETPPKIARRRDEGCVTVEMEAAAFFAVAQFREAVLGQILYSGDDVGSDNWDSRDWNKDTSTRQKLFLLAAEACLSIP